MKRLLGDLRALGAGAPVRIAYEVLKRLGVTGGLLRLRSRRTRTPAMTSPFDAATVGPAPGASLIEEADRVRAGVVRIFDRDVEVGETPDWHADGAGGAWPRLVWWRIDLTTDPGRDVKHVWEVARHRHLVSLAGAARASADGKPYLETLERHLASWLDQNPPEIGVHWYSNLELALRAIAWLRVDALVGDELDPQLRAGLARHLFHSGRHLVAELPRAGRRWARRGDRLLRRHIPHHFAADGSSLEDSLGYRGFVDELLAARVLMGEAPDPVSSALEASARHLMRLGVGGGPVPHFGDWDGGRALSGTAGEPLPESALDVAQATVAGSGSDPAVTDGSDAGGGVARLERGPWTAWLKAGSGASHGHADLLSVAVHHRGTWVSGDPGNGSYNRSLDESNYFRTSIAHNALRLAGTDQREPHRNFRWRYSPVGRLGVPFDLGEYRVMWGTHDAYERLPVATTVLRACLLGPNAVIVADWTSSDDAPWDLSIPLHPDVTYEVAADDSVAGTSARLVLQSGVVLGLSLPAPAETVRGSRDPFDGWWADDYDSIRPAVRLQMNGAGPGPVVWAVWRRFQPDLAVADGSLIVDGLELTAGSETGGTFELFRDGEAAPQP
jgi:hypothetical protein